MALNCYPLDQIDYESFTYGTKLLSIFYINARPLLAKVLSAELRHARLNSRWGFVCFPLLAKAVLRTPQGGKRKRYVVSALILARLHRWQEGDLVSLWEEARAGYRAPHPHTSPEDIPLSNAKRALRQAREGRYAAAMRALGSAGCASPDNAKALNDLLSRHPQHPIPQRSGVHSTPPSISVDPEAVLSALKSFLHGSSPGVLVSGCNISFQPLRGPLLWLPRLV